MYKFEVIVSTKKRDYTKRYVADSLWDVYYFALSNSDKTVEVYKRNFINKISFSSFEETIYKKGIPWIRYFDNYKRAFKKRRNGSIQGVKHKSNSPLLQKCSTRHVNHTPRSTILDKELIELGVRPRRKDIVKFDRGAQYIRSRNSMSWKNQKKRHQWM